MTRRKGDNRAFVIIEVPGTVFEISYKVRSLLSVVLRSVS